MLAVLSDALICSLTAIYENGLGRCMSLQTASVLIGPLNCPLGTISKDMLNPCHYYHALWVWMWSA
jgi:hypothetical protein